METNNIKDYEDYVGEQVIGFKFDSSNACEYAPEMEDYIGDVGTIISWDSDYCIFEVDFGDDFWYYPADLVIKQLEQKEELIEMMEKDEEFGVYDDSEESDTEPKSFECASCEREKLVSDRTNSRPNVCNKCLDEEEDYEPQKSVDPIIEKVCAKFRQRSSVGLHKYNTTLADSTDGIDKFLLHLQEELMDAINYIETLKHKIQLLKDSL